MGGKLQTALRMLYLCIVNEPPPCPPQGKKDSKGLSLTLPKKEGTK